MNCTPLALRALLMLALLVLLGEQPALGVQIGDRVRCITNGTNVRPDRSTSSTPYYSVNIGALGVILNGPYSGTGNAFTWYLVQWDGQTQAGYTASQNYSVVVPSAPVITFPGSASAPGPQISTLSPTFHWGVVPGSTGNSIYIRDTGTNVLYNYLNVASSGGDWNPPAGTLQAGHTYKWNMVASNSAGDSVVSNSLYFQTVPPQLPNLTSFQPAGWADKIVVSRNAGDHTDSSSLTTADSLFVDWSIFNNGAASTAARFYTKLYLDGNYVTQWYTDPPMGTGAGSAAEVQDYPLGTLSAGSHTLQITIDATDTVSESNEAVGDNTYTKTITIAQAPTATIFDAWWSDQVDNDADGYKRSAVLRWDPDVVDSTGSLSVYEKIYVKFSTAVSWDLLYTTAAHTITGNTGADGQSLPINGGDRRLYDWKIEIYRSGQSFLDYVLDPLTDVDLNDYALETQAEDTPLSLAITSPATSTSWMAGTSQNIMWTLAGNSTSLAYFKVALSLDGGETWPSAGTSNDLTPAGIYDPTARSFYWAIPSALNTATARIRIRALAADSTILAETAMSGNFTIFPPLLTTIYNAWWSDEVDNDGDGYKQSFRLNWDADVVGGAGTISVFERIYYKLASSSGWTLINTTAAHAISGLDTADAVSLGYTGGNHNLYDWKVEVLRSGQTAVDYTRDPANDSDLNDYKIETAAEDAASLSLTLNSPNGGQTFQPGSTQSVQWSVNGSATNQGLIRYFWVSVSTNGGLSYTAYNTATAGSRSLAWLIPSGWNTSTVRILVQAFGATNNLLASDTSDEDFSVTPPATPLVAVIVGSESVYQGGSLTFHKGGSSAGSYHWDYNDGHPSQDGPSVTRTFNRTGRWDVIMTVTTATGSKQASIKVTVQGQGTGTGQTTFNLQADPINLANGNYISDHVDLKIKGRGLEFQFRRFYNSGAYNPDATDPTATLGSLGYGWRHNFETRLSECDSADCRTVHWEDGRHDGYQLIGGIWTPAAGVYDTLVENPDLTAVLTTKHQIRYFFDSFGRLTAIKDRNDNTITVAYDAPGIAGKVDFVTDTVGRVIDFQYNDDGRLTAIVDPINRRIEFDFNANKDLIAVRDARQKQTSYTYDSLHQMLKGIDPLGNIYVENKYGTSPADLRAVVEQWDALRNHTRLEYNFATRVTRVFDPLCDADVTRLPEIHEHDDHLRLIKRTDQSGNFESFEYVDAGMSKHIDRRGNASTFNYDLRGNHTLTLDAEGQRASATYTLLNDPDIVTGVTGIKKRYLYTPQGNVEAIVFPFVDTLPASRYRTSFTYGSFGLPATKTDALGRITRYFYDAEANLKRITNPELHDTVMTFDGVGRELSKTDPLSHTTSQTWSPTDKILTTTDALTLTATNEYDDNDNRITQTDRRLKVTRFVFNAKDKLIKTIYPDLTEVRTDYDALDRVWKTYDARNKMTEHRYTAAGFLERIIDPLSHATIYLLDPEGNVLQTTDADGVVTNFTYDKINRRTKAGVVLNATTTLETLTEYQTGGLVKSTTDPDGRKTNFFYDEADRHFKTVDAAGGTAECAFNDVGGKLWSQDANGQRTTFTFTDLDLVRTETDARGKVWTTSYDFVGNPTSTLNPNGQTITRQFTVRNELERIIYPSGPPVVFTYDEEGHPRTMTDSLGLSETTYDDRGRPSLYTDPFGKTLGFQYDENGQRKTITYPGNKQVTLGYDDAGRAISHTDWLNRIISRSYTNAGRPLGMSFPNGVQSSYTHDAAGRLNGFAHQKTDSSLIASSAYTFSNAGDITGTTSDPVLDPFLPASNSVTTHTSANLLATIDGTPVAHDENGNLTSGNLAGGAVPHTLTFDFEDRLLTLTKAGVTTANRYNGRGQRLETSRAGTVTRFVVDPFVSLSQIMAETDAAGNVTAYYLYLGGLAAKVLPDGTASYYHGNHQGSIVALTAGDGSVTDTYQYDPFGVPMGGTGTSDNHFKYLGIHGLWDNGDGTVFARARHYHLQLGRFLSRDPLSGKLQDPQSLNRYIYALNNPLRLIDPSGLTSREVSSSYNGIEIDNAAIAALCYKYCALLGIEEGQAGPTVINDIMESSKFLSNKQAVEQEILNSLLALKVKGKGYLVRDGGTIGVYAGNNAVGHVNITAEAYIVSYDIALFDGYTSIKASAVRNWSFTDQYEFVIDYSTLKSFGKTLVTDALPAAFVGAGVKYPISGKFTDTISIDYVQKY